MMVPGNVRSMALEARVLVGLSTWTMKSPGLLEGVGVERSAIRQVLKSLHVWLKVSSQLYCPLRHRALRQSDLPFPCLREYFSGLFRKPSPANPHVTRSLITENCLMDNETLVMAASSLL